MTASPPVTRDFFIWDNHGCMPLRADESYLPQLARYRDAGVSVVSINIGYGAMPWPDHMLLLSFMRRWIETHPDKFGLVSTIDDIARLREQRRLGVVFDIEGMVPVEDNIHLVQTFYELGVRWMLIAYNKNNKAGGGCLDEDGGLTATGRAIIHEMERVGMVLCLSHTGARTSRAALEITTKPVILSHSNAFGDNPHPRNVSDELLMACAATGGVIGLNGIGRFLGTNINLVDRLLRQVMYIVDLVGAAHVGLGLDYVFDVAELEANVKAKPEYFASGTQVGADRATIAPEQVGAVVEGLLKLNLSDDDVKGILGANWMRIATQVWQ